jgi:hypothetical protein
VANGLVVRRGIERVQMCAGFHFWMCRYGCSFLEAMLRKLKVLGISVWLDMHALPGGAQARVPYGGVYYPDSQVPPSPRHVRFASM